MKNSKKIIEAAPFMIPSLLGMIVFSFLPIIISIIISMTEWNGLDKLDIRTLSDSFIGISNYVSIIGGEEFWKVLWHTVYYILLYIPLVLICSLTIASILNQSMKGIAVLRVLYYIPVLTSWVAASLIWRWVLSPQYGILNQLLAIVGITGPNWLTDKIWAMPAIVLASVWKDMGFYGLFLLSGLKAIDTGVIMALINAFQLFPQVMIMTEGGPNGATQVMVERIYTYGFSYFEMGYAAAYSWILFVIIFLLTLLQLKLQKRWVHYES